MRLENDGCGGVVASASAALVGGGSSSKNSIPRSETKEYRYHGLFRVCGRSVEVGFRDMLLLVGAWQGELRSGHQLERR